MNSKRVLLVVSFIALSTGVFGQSRRRCDYERISLGIAIDAARCEEKCIAHSSSKTSRCFAYTYTANNEDCDGYVIEYDGRYASYRECGIIEGANLAFTPPEAIGSLPSDNDKCSLSLTSLGISPTAQDCEHECKNLVSSAYGGCAAWFYDPRDEDCDGVLSDMTSYGSDVCQAV